MEPSDLDNMKNNSSNTEDEIELLMKSKELLDGRLKLYRFWIILGFPYFIAQFLMIDVHMLDSLNGNAYLFYVPAVIWTIIIIAVLVSFLRADSLHVIRPLLFLYSIEFIYQDFLKYIANKDNEYAELLVWQQFFSIMICFFNCFLQSMIYENMAARVISISVQLIILHISLLYTSVDYNDLTNIKVNALVINTFFSIILITSFIYMTHLIFREHSQDVVNHIRLKNQFLQMFHSLEEGVVLFNDDKVEFMNKLSNGMLSYVTQKANFMREALEMSDIHNESVESSNPME